MAEDTDNTIELVKQAQLGDEKSLETLAELASERLYPYVYRYLLEEEQTRDIVQETILKMLKVLGELKEADRFWPWLFKIALNKIFIHHRTKKQHVKATRTIAAEIPAHSDKQTAIAAMVGHELKEIIFKAMRELKPKYRDVINMRCYDEMSYSEIAKVMGCSNFAAQMVFYRAKKALKKELVRNGFSKGSLVMALAFFGKMTAPTKAVATGLMVTEESLKVGALASFLSILTAKITAVSIMTAVFVTFGALSLNPEIFNLSKNVEKEAVVLAGCEQIEYSFGDTNSQCWYYQPGHSRAVMLRYRQSCCGEGFYCKYLQNAEANYQFDPSSNTVYINNHRAYNDDMSMVRLPIDRSGDNLTSLLTIVEHPNEDESAKVQVTHHENLLAEDYFKYDWPACTKLVDRRDKMHKRGWAYFNVSGMVDGKVVRGEGRIPFVYAAYKTHKPWLKLRIGEQSFFDRKFVGLSRPWLGLHTIDTIRKDAIKRGVSFETSYDKCSNKAQLVLDLSDTKIIYTIDMENDVIEKIDITGSSQGQLSFEYLQEIDVVAGKFSKGENDRRREFDIIEFLRD